MRASVVIRTKDEAADLGDVLDRVWSQRHPDFEVIVVDSGSTDATVAIAEEKGARVVRIAPEEFTYGRALNVGAREADGEAVVFLSGHALPFDRDWLGDLIAPFDDETVAGVAGRHMPRADCNPFDARGLRRRFADEAGSLPTPSGINFANANAAVRRLVWERFPFDETLPFSEDLEWQERVRRAGWRLVYAPLAAVRHSHNDEPERIGRRMHDQTRARVELGLGAGPTSCVALAVDLIAGTAYDLWTAARSADPLRWILHAPRRRFWINAGRYSGSRGIAWSDRPLLALVRWLAARLAGRSVDGAGRTP